MHFPVHALAHAALPANNPHKKTKIDACLLGHTLYPRAGKYFSHTIQVLLRLRINVKLYLLFLCQAERKQSFCSFAVVLLAPPSAGPGGAPAATPAASRRVSHRPRVAGE